jgi:hypothetical protein
MKKLAQKITKEDLMVGKEIKFRRSNMILEMHPKLSEYYYSEITEISYNKYNNKLALIAFKCGLELKTKHYISEYSQDSDNSMQGMSSIDTDN